MADKRPSEDIVESETKKQHIEANVIICDQPVRQRIHSDDVEDSDMESPVKYTELKNLKGVFQADTIRPPDKIREDLGLEEDPICLIISGSNANKILYLLQQCLTKDTEEVEKPEKRTETFAKVKATETMKKFDDFTARMDFNSRSYSIGTLKKDLENKTEFECFRDIRKQLYGILAFGNKTKNMVRKFLNGYKNQLSKIQIDFAPTRLERSLIQDSLKELHECNHNVNIKLMNEIVKKLDTQLDILEEKIATVNCAIVAKAWRATKLGNPKLKYENFRKTDYIDRQENDDNVFEEVTDDNTDRIFKRRETVKQAENRPKFHERRNTFDRRRNQQYTSRRNSYRNRYERDGYTVPERQKYYHNYRQEDRDDYDEDERNYRYNYRQYERDEHDDYTEHDRRRQRYNYRQNDRDEYDSYTTNDRRKYQDNYQQGERRRDSYADGYRNRRQSERLNY